MRLLRLVVSMEALHRVWAWENKWVSCVARQVTPAAVVAIRVFVQAQRYCAGAQGGVRDQREMRQAVVSQTLQI